jgi:hypothetical protein
MPTNRRRRPKAVRPHLSDGQRQYLRTGRYVSRDRVEYDSWFDTFQLAGMVMRLIARGGEPPEEWVEHGVEITAAHIAEEPGSRPHAWWCFEAPGPRECTGIPAALPPFWLWKLHLGLPFEWHRLEVGTVLRLESEAHYLRRHRLLAPGERRRIDLTAFEPEEIIVGDPDDDEGDGEG